jgi:hypothetical protein
VSESAAFEHHWRKHPGMGGQRVQDPNVAARDYVRDSKPKDAAEAYLLSAAFQFHESTKRNELMAAQVCATLAQTDKLEEMTACLRESIDRAVKALDANTQALNKVIDFQQARARRAA